MIWRQNTSLASLNQHLDAVSNYLEIRFCDISADTITAAMPVSPKVHQPYGILHGGISVVLAETVGSYASSLVVDTQKYRVVGMEINANHLKPVASGSIRAVCSPLHLGKSSHVWDIRIYNDNAELICISRLTVAVVKRS